VEPIPQSEPWFDREEADAVHRYMLSGGWVTEFRQTDEFERRLAAFTGAAHCVATTSGTVSLVLALLVLDVGPGDQVIVPNMTMIATANAARLVGADPVFVDVEAETLNIDISQVEAAVTPATRAVIHVSLNGRSNDLDALRALCGNYGLHLMEDAAQSLGSYFGDRHLGTIGDLGCLSFSPPKVISTGQGGAVLTNDGALAAKLRKVKDFGRTHGSHDIHDAIGYNFKFTDVQSVIGIEQMKKLPWRLQRKKEIWALYREKLADMGGVDLVDTNLDLVAPWFVDVYVDDRDGLAEHLKDLGIGSRPVYPPVHSQRAYGLDDLSFPVSERFSRRGLWLPSSSQLTDDQIVRVCDGVRGFFTG